MKINKNIFSYSTEFTLNEQDWIHRWLGNEPKFVVSISQGFFFTSALIVKNLHFHNCVTEINLQILH